MILSRCLIPQPLAAPHTVPFTLAYQSSYSCCGGGETQWYLTIKYDVPPLCYVQYVKPNALMMQTWLSGAAAKASGCVRDLMAEPGGLKRGQQSSDLLARSARSFILCVSRSITLLVILKNTLALPTCRRCAVWFCLSKNAFNSHLFGFIVLTLKMFLSTLNKWLNDIFDVSVC